MVEFWNVIAIIFTVIVISLFAGYLIFNDKDFFFDKKERKEFIITCAIFIVLIVLGCSVSFFTDVKVRIIEAKATIQSFEEVKNKKEQLGDNYILEPSVLSDYAKALKTLEKYKRLGLIKE